MAKVKVNKKNLVDYIIQYEGGELSDNDTLDLFAYLVKTGQCYSLQGHYGRTATALIQDNFIDRKGQVLKYV